MTTAMSTTPDTQLRDSVIREIEWDPTFDGSGIGVSTHDDAVTLTGFVDSYTAKLSAERAAKRVWGVRAVANDIQVRLPQAHTDDEIARAAAHALSLRIGMPTSVQAVVRQGHLTLTGTVEWLFHRTSAERAVRHVRGVVGLTNHIHVVPAVSAGDVARRISEALHRAADLNARHIHVVINGSTVMLSGQVTSWAQRDTAERAVAGAPGISHIENRIAVSPAETSSPAPR